MPSMNATFISLPLLAALAAGTLFAFLGLIYKAAQVHDCRTRAFAAIFTLIATGFAAARAIWEPAVWHNPRLWLLGVSMGVLLYAGFPALIRANRLGPPSVCWLMVNLSLLMPIGLSWLCLGEALRPVHGLILALFLLMLPVLAIGTGGTSDGAAGTQRGFWLSVAALFLVNGLFSFGAKLKSIWFPEGSAAALATLYFGTAAVLAVVTAARRGQGLRFSATEWRIGICGGACCGIANLFFLAGASLPAALFYPLVQGLSLLGGVLLIAWVYQEHFTPAKWAGLALGLGVLVLTVLADIIKS